jgi:hypothetical protein
MKIFLHREIHCALLLLLGIGAFSSQSCVAAGHISQAVVLSGNASAESVRAVGESAQGSVQVVSGFSAIPVYLSGAVLAGSGNLVASAALASAEMGAELSRGGKALWDFATSDPAARPALDRQRSVPPLKNQAAPRPSDPPPGVAMKAAR